MKKKLNIAAATAIMLTIPVYALFSFLELNYWDIYLSIGLLAVSALCAGASILTPRDQSKKPSHKILAYSLIILGIDILLFDLLIAGLIGGTIIASGIAVALVVGIIGTFVGSLLA